MNELIQQLLSVDAALELALLATSLALSFAIVRLWRGRIPTPGSLWFGERIYDGVLFPSVALVAAALTVFALKRALPHHAINVALPVLVSLTVIRTTVRVLNVAFPASSGVRLIERTLSWIAWIAAVAWILGVLPVVLDAMDQLRWHLGGTEVSLRRMIEGGVTLLFVLLAALWLSAFLERRLLEGDPSNLSLRMIAANTLRALLLVVGTLVALSAAGIPIGALSVLGGAIGVGIGFGLQRLASNYVSGFVILAERSMHIGDTVKVDGFEGRITDIKTRYTVVRSLSGRESIVPNEMMISSRVESSADTNVAVLSNVTVAYGTDLDALVPRLIERMHSVPRVLKDPKCMVMLNNFAADGLELMLLFWINDPQNGQANVRSDINFAVWRLLRELAIEIPYPQRVLHQAVVDQARGSPDTETSDPSSGSRRD